MYISYPLLYSINFSATAASWYLTKAVPFEVLVSLFITILAKTTFPYFLNFFKSSSSVTLIGKFLMNISEPWSSAILASLLSSFYYSSSLSYPFSSFASISDSYSSWSSPSISYFSSFFTSASSSSIDFLSSALSSFKRSAMYFCFATD